MYKYKLTKDGCLDCDEPVGMTHYLHKYNNLLKKYEMKNNDKGFMQELWDFHVQEKILFPVFTVQNTKINQANLVNKFNSL